MTVKARYKDAPEDEWFEVVLTDDRRMYDKVTGQEITRTDLLFKPLDGEDADIIDMEKEWEDYRHERLCDFLEEQAYLLAKQVLSYDRDKE